MNNLFVLVGIKHCGKSTLVSNYNKKHGTIVFDTDDILSHDYKNCKIRELFKNLGEKEFRKAEYNSIKNFLENDLPKTEELIILATGGGLADYPDSLKLLQQYGSIIYLKVNEAVLYQRISTDGIPPFMTSGNPKLEFHSLYVRRDHIYSLFSDFVLYLSECNEAEAIKQLEIIAGKKKEICQIRSE